MNMLEEAYREEILRQIDHIGMEIIALTNDNPIPVPPSFLFLELSTL